MLLVLAVALGPLVAHAIFSGAHRNELMSPGEVSQEFQVLRGNAADAFQKKKVEVGTLSALAIKAHLHSARADLVKVSDDLGKQQGWFSSFRPQKILERKALELRQTALRSEIGLLEAADEMNSIDVRLRTVMAPTEGAIAAATRSCDAAKAEAARFNARNGLDRSVRNLLAKEAQRLTENRDKACAVPERLANQRRKALQDVGQLRADLAQAKKAYLSAGSEGENAISEIRIDLSKTVQSVLLKAAVLLAGIVATPYLIRLVFYFILAPLAERRPSVRFDWRAEPRRASVTLLQASATSAPIKLGAGEELLVRQGFLQSTSSAGAKATRAILDWRHPLTSVASGLAFLTRINGEGETTVVSAVRDPFAEVAVLDLPLGAACVLQPRTLVGVVQPAGQPIRITSHWRLGSLHAWLTLQLRYLMFHGPARLLVKGGRGVRVEQAERGRIFGQSQLVGFSPELAYTVTRTETFWPYFLGLEQLLKDKVEAGEGVLIVEEAPMDAGGRLEPRRGLEGAADVILKAVGV